MSFAVIDTQPKRNPAPLDHGGRSMEDISDDYFSTMSPIGRKLITEKRKCMDSHRRDWERLTQKEKDTILDEWFIDPKIQLRYELKLGKISADGAPECFPRLKVHGGGKEVHYSEQDDGSHSQNQSKETVSWKDEFSGPFCWETKCQQELTILATDTISASSIPSPSISHDLIKVSDPEVETDAEWFAKSNKDKDKNKLSVMLMRDVSNRSSLGNNLLASSSERLAFDQAVNTALASKPKPKDKASTNNHDNGERKSSQGSVEGKKKNTPPEPSEKTKSAPPTSLRQKSSSKSSLNKEPDRKIASGGKVKDKSKNGLPPSSPRRDSGSKSSESKSSESASPRRDSGSKAVGLGSPRRDSAAKKKSEKKQLLPAGFLTELELKVQDNVNFDPGVQQDQHGQGDAEAGGSPKDQEAESYEFLFDW